MGKLEKEIKVLNINKKELEKKLDELGATKQEEGIQQIYVYDLQSIYSRFYDCVSQLQQCKKSYEYEIYRNKLRGILNEVDNLMTEENRNELEKCTNNRYLVSLLNKTDNTELFNTFSNEHVRQIVKSYGINPNKWVRLRKSKGKTTLTVKHILKQDENGSNIQKVMETEMEVPSIEDANNMLEQLGFSYRNYQEKNRAKYILDGVEIDIDKWPMIPTYVEIENDSEQVIEDILKKLQLENHEIVSCNTTDVYKKYGIDIYQFRELKLSENEKNGVNRDD